MSNDAPIFVSIEHANAIYNISSNSNGDKKMIVKPVVYDVLQDIGILESEPSNDVVKLITDFNLQLDDDKTLQNAKKKANEEVAAAELNAMKLKEEALVAQNAAKLADSVAKKAAANAKRAATTKKRVISAANKLLGETPSKKLKSTKMIKIMTEDEFFMHDFVGAKIIYCSFNKCEFITGCSAKSIMDHLSQVMDDYIPIGDNAPRIKDSLQHICMNCKKDNIVITLNVKLSNGIVLKYCNG